MSSIMRHAMLRRAVPIAPILAILLTVPNGLDADAASADGTLREQVLVLVDRSIYREIRRPLRRYFKHVMRRHNVEFEVLSETWYERTPYEIRRALKQAYETKRCVVGAIMVGDIPYATYQHDDGTINPAALYYEDFEARWINADDDEHFEKIETNTVNNPTEIWTAWWVPPTDDRAEQPAMLRTYLRKLDRYYRGELEGRGGGVFMASEMNNEGFTKEWAEAFARTFEGSGQSVTVWSRFVLDENTVTPALDEDFHWSELEQVLSTRRFKYLHVFAHGLPTGFYWGIKAFAWHGGIDVDRFHWFTMHGTGANFMTSSGCRTGNFRGTTDEGPEHARSIANYLLFSPETITITFYGSASSQSTALFPKYFKELFDGLRGEGGDSLAAGYLRMRNADHVWGETHYFFRGIDDKVLLGDPFITLNDWRK